MANICNTDIRVYGDGENFSKLVSDLDKICVNSEGRMDKNVWIGELAEIMGMDIKHTDLRAWIYFYNTEEANGGGSFSMAIESKWVPPYEWMRRIEEFYEGVGISYLADECGCGIYETNDPEYFDECRFKVWVEDHDEETFSTEEEARDYVKSCGVILEDEEMYGITEFEICSLYDF